MYRKNKNIIIAGGGTGGHVYPAIAIAQSLKEADPEVNILFVGALGKMEMEKVPSAGFQIKGLPVKGFQRRLTYKNVLFFFYLFASMLRSYLIVSRFKPGVVVGVGGYASGPVLKIASWKKIPYVLQEQNSYAGATNRMLAAKASLIFVAYEGMERYFPAQKIVLSGNPLRSNLGNIEHKSPEACKGFQVSKDLPVLLVLGGSLGAGSVNESMLNNYHSLLNENIQIIWQTGKNYYERIIKEIPDEDLKKLRVQAFINRMDLAYSLADVIVSRAGAGTISELCLVGKPVILVPSPNVAEDHQAKNAAALEAKNAAKMIRDHEAMDKLVPEVINLMNRADLREQFSLNIQKMGFKNSARIIADEILKLCS